MDTAETLDDVDRRLIRATQEGLPLVAEPYHAVADALGVVPSEVMDRLRRMMEQGAVRRIGAVPNHYALGYSANGMSVWDVEDDVARDIGRQVGDLEFVSHAYLRPRHPPVWQYNLFAMVHGRTRNQVEEKVGRIAELIGAASRSHTVLYSRRILKKTGLRLAG